MIFSESEARERAEKLAKILKKDFGFDWSIRVWDNLGWHYSVYLKIADDLFVSVHPDYQYKKYHVLAGHSVNCGNADWYDTNSYDSPKEAVNATIAIIRRHAQQAINYANKVMKAMGFTPFESEE